MVYCASPFSGAFTRMNRANVSRYSIALVVGLMAHAAAAIEKAFNLSKCPAVAVVINSPGGSAVQSSLLFRRMRQLAEEKKKTVYTFCEDVAASGGYYLALAGDEVYADASSIVGSIGVIFSGFGFDKAIDKLGIERRVYTAGDMKDALDPFRPERADGLHDIRTTAGTRRVENDAGNGLGPETSAECSWIAEKRCGIGLHEAHAADTVAVRGAPRVLHGLRDRLDADDRPPRP